MMRCKNCGEYLRGTSIYCDKCGHKVEIDLDRTRVFEFDLAEINMPDHDSVGVEKEPLIRRGNFLPMFFSISALVCVMALCVAVLTYAITYDMKTQTLRRTSNIGAENGLTVSEPQTLPPENALPAQELTTTTAAKSTTTRKTASETTTTTTTTKKATDESQTTTEAATTSVTTTSVTTTTTPRETTAFTETTKPSDFDTIVQPESERFMSSMYVAADKGELFLRTGPGYGYDFVNFVGISAASEADVYAEAFDEASGETWLYVHSGGYTGWTTPGMLSDTKPKVSRDRDIVYFTAQTSKKTDLYSGAGRYYFKKGTVSKGSLVEIMDFSEDYSWLYVYVGGKYGWIKAENVELEGFV